MTDDELKFVSEKISKEADSYAKRECPNPDTRFFYWKAYVTGTNRALEMAMNALEQSSIWSGMGYKVSYRELYQRLCELHNYPKELYDEWMLVEGSANEDLNTEIYSYFEDWYDGGPKEYGGMASKPNCHFASVEDCKDIARHFARWQREQMMKDAVDGEILAIEDCNYSMNSHTHLEMYVDEVKLIEKGFKDGDKVKLIIIKED